MGERRTSGDPRDDGSGDRNGDAGTPRFSTAANPDETDGSAVGSGPNTAGSGSSDGRRWARTESGGDRPSDGATDRTDDEGRLSSALDRLTAIEQWAPADGGEATRTVRRHLRPDESVQVADDARLVGDHGGPAAVGLTDDRLLVVTDGGLVGVGLDRICAVRSSVETTVGARGMDARLLGGLGYFLSVVAFLAVLGAAANPLTPTLALVTVGGVFAFDHVRREGVDVNGRTLTDRLRHHDTGAALADGLAGVERRLLGIAGPDPLARWAAGAAAVVPFAALLALEPNLLAPLFALATVASFGLVVYAVRNSEALGGIEVVKRRRRTVSATVDDGSTVALWTRPDSPVDRELAARLGGFSRIDAA
ncbi:MAG: hypothetical protein ABEJ26_07050 [Halosimplex sp.]